MAAIGEPESLASLLEVEIGVPELSYELTVKITSAMEFTKNKRPDWASGNAPKCTFAHLPLTPEHQGLRKSTIMHLIDYITNWEDELDEDQLVGLMQGTPAGQAQSSEIFDKTNFECITLELQLARPRCP